MRCLKVEAASGELAWARAEAAERANRARAEKAELRGRVSDILKRPPR